LNSGWHYGLYCVKCGSVPGREVRCGRTADDEYIKTMKKIVININFKNIYFEVRSNIIKEKA